MHYFIGNHQLNELINWNRLLIEEKFAGPGLICLSSRLLMLLLLFFMD